MLGNIVRLNTSHTRSYHSSLISYKMKSKINAINIPTSFSKQNKKIKRQKKYAKEIMEMGFDFNAHLSEAKTTLNRILMYDAKTLDLVDIGNGNVRNLKDRLIPKYMDMLKKKGIKLEGSYTYAQLRNLVLLNTDTFKEHKNKVKITGEKKKKTVEMGENNSFFERCMNILSLVNISLL
eukprot:TRINITY_DN1188_c1_g2_i1.p1 TRINITY_DN1188_c1_g2~~TRINITY_DN1188_c1_g2_i1.p1  ORF type:complete len:187 (-),score=33.59 TRINITY_DN1188_c1_g2_i1:330-866(-)